MFDLFCGQVKCSEKKAKKVLISFDSFISKSNIIIEITIVKSVGQSSEITSGICLYFLIYRARYILMWQWYSEMNEQNREIY